MIDVRVETPTLPPASPARAALERPYLLADWERDLHASKRSVPTGFDFLEDLEMCWVPAQVVAVIARPGNGKTQFLLEACVRFLEANAAAHAVFLSWEVPLADVVLRLILRADAHRTLVNGDRPDPLPLEAVRAFGRGEPTAPKYQGRIATALEDVGPLLSRLRLVDGDAVGRNVLSMLREVAMWMREADAPTVGLVAVDYFQKLSGPPGGNVFSRQNELRAVSDLLRRFAKGARLTTDSEHGDVLEKAYEVPVLVGAQVNRNDSSSNSSTGHPTGDNIRESDDLLQDASTVLALSWEDLANPEDTREQVRYFRVSVPKHRGGATRPAVVARVEWRAARMWIHRQCKRDAGGRVLWEEPKNDTGAVNGGASKTPKKSAGQSVLSAMSLPDTTREAP